MHLKVQFDPGVLIFLFTSYLSNLRIHQFEYPLLILGFFMIFASLLVIDLYDN